MEHSEPSCLEVAVPSERVEQLAEHLTLERRGHRVDRAVPAEEIVAQGGVLDARQRCGSVIRLGARGRYVDPLLVAVANDRGAELLVRVHVTAESCGQDAGEADRVALDHDVDVESPLAEQDVAHRATDQEDALVSRADLGDRIQDRRQVLRKVKLRQSPRSPQARPRAARRPRLSSVPVASRPCAGRRPRSSPGSRRGS